MNQDAAAGQSANANADKRMPPVVVFAMTHRVLDGRGNSNDFARLGHYVLKEDGSALVNYRRYDAARNQKPTPLDFNHPDLMATGRPGWPVMSPTEGQRVSDSPASWSVSGTVLEVKIGKSVHVWAEQKTFWSLLAVRNSEDGTNTIDGLTWLDVHGYAVGAESATTPERRRLERGDLLPVYSRGEMRFRLKRKGQSPIWTTKAQIWRVDRYGEHNGLLARMDLNPEMKVPMRRFSAIALNAAPTEPLLIYHNTGNDFNRDNVFNEYGHTIVFHGAWNKGKVDPIVFVECSYQDDGVALIGAGWYGG